MTSKKLIKAIEAVKAECERHKGDEINIGGMFFTTDNCSDPAVEIRVYGKGLYRVFFDRDGDVSLVQNLMNK